MDKYQKALSKATPGSEAYKTAQDNLTLAHTKLADAQRLGAQVAGKTIPEAFQDSIKSIKDAKDKTDALNIATGLFGTRGAVQMVDAIRSGKFNFDEMTKAVDKSNDSIQETGKRTMTIGGQFATLKNAAEVNLEPIATKTFKGINVALAEVMKGLTAFMNDLPAIGRAIEPFADAVGRAFGTLGPTIKATFDAAKPALKALGDALALITDLLTGKWGKAWKDAGAFVRAFLDYVKAVPKMLYELFTTPFREILAYLGGTPAKMGQAIADLLPTTIGNVFRKIPAEVTKALKGFFDLVGKIPGQTGDALIDLGKSVFTAIEAGFLWAWSGAEAGLKSFWGDMTALPLNVIKALADPQGPLWSPLSARASVRRWGPHRALWAASGAWWGASPATWSEGSAIWARRSGASSAMPSGASSTARSTESRISGAGWVGSAGRSSAPSARSARTCSTPGRTSWAGSPTASRAQPVPWPERPRTCWAASTRSSRCRRPRKARSPSPAGPCCGPAA